MKRSKIKNRTGKTAVCLALILGISGFSPSFAMAAETDMNTIHIKTQDDLEELAENCRLDTWSQGKTVVLDNDIVLDGDAEDFLPIPTFGGIFDGNGHTIDGLSITGDDSNTGLFDRIQNGASVTDLTVVGQVAPSGEGDIIGGIAGKNSGDIINCVFEGSVYGDVSVGGIVGINETTGRIINCSFKGTITGEHYVGGIAGQNTGSIIRCENRGDINTTAIEVSPDISDLSALRTTESVPAGTDIGGIAGFSSGMIQGCKNAGQVGYEHMGYNVGGIVGRQSGYLDGCMNEGLVQGRKDVGGIAGQMEPQVILRYDEDILQKLWTELDTLQNMIGRALDDAGAASDTVSGDIERIISDVGAAKDAANDLSGAIVDWGNENIGQINDASARLSWVISESVPVTEDITDALDYMSEAASLFSHAADNAGDAGEHGADAASELGYALNELKNASEHVENTKEHLSAAVSIAEDIIKGGDGGYSAQDILDELSSAREDIKNALEAPEKIADYADSAKKYLERAGEAGGDALRDLSDASEELSSSVSGLEDAMEKVGDIAQTLADEPEISFSPIGSDVSDRGDVLDATLSQMLNSMSGLQDSLLSSSDTVLDDFKGINDQIGVITGILQQSVEENQDEEVSDRFEDISDDDTDDTDLGIIAGSVNNGEVCGDVNVAGIVGSLSIEYDFDPEDDLTKDGTRSLDFKYKTLAVVKGCVNEGGVSGKKDYAGGIVGRMDLGAVKDCENYGNIESSDGDYVGGISGLTRSVIRDCFVKCSLSGGDYVGGVTGSSEDDSVVSGCYTLVEITDCGRYSGAVSGTENGEFSENYYVSDSLAGLGRISYAGKAEPISFEAMTQVSGLPREMTQFTLRFVVEDEEIKTESFSYGDSFGEDVFPEIPAKDGYYASWDTDDLTDLKFDKIVTAEYERYVLALASEVTRESGRPVFLADGDFDDGDTLIVSSVGQPETVNGKTALEQWYLSFSDKSKDSYSVRYLSQDESPEGFNIYVKNNGQWEKTEYTSFGSYVVFTVPSAEAEIAVTEALSPWVMRIALAIGGLLILAAVILAVKKIIGRKKKGGGPDNGASNTMGEAKKSKVFRNSGKAGKARKDKRAAIPEKADDKNADGHTDGRTDGGENDDMVKGKTDDGIDEGADNAAKSGGTENAQNVQNTEKIEKTENTESTDTTGDTDSADYSNDTGDTGKADMEEEGNDPDKKDKKNKKDKKDKKDKKAVKRPGILSRIKAKKGIMPALGAVIFVCAAVAILAGIKISSAAEACDMLRELASDSDQALTLSLDTELDGKLTHTDIDIVKTVKGNHDVTCITSGGISLYYTEGFVIMENGKAYKVNDLHPDYSDLLSKASEIFDTVTFSADRNGDGVDYELTAEGENAKALLKLLLPEQAEYLSDTHKITVSMTATDDSIASLSFYSEGTLADEDKTPYTVSAEITPSETETDPIIPSEVSSTIYSGNIEAETVISEDFFRLLSAWRDLDSEGTFSADVTLEAECGPLSLNDKIKYEQTFVDGQKIGRLRKNDTVIYFSDGIFCDQKGKGLEVEESGLENNIDLLEILYQICMNGEFDCVDAGNDKWLYTLNLDEDAMKAVACAVDPELENIPVILSSGSIQAVVNGDTITDIDVECKGRLETDDGIINEVSQDISQEISQEISSASSQENGGEVSDASSDTEADLSWDISPERSLAEISVKMDFTPDSGFSVPNAVKERLFQERTVENEE